MGVRKFKKGDRVKIQGTSTSAAFDKGDGVVSLFSNIRGEYGVRFEGVNFLTYFSEKELAPLECRKSKHI